MQLKHTKTATAHLNQLGLTQNESDIYLFLLQNGLMSGNKIYSQLNLDKSSCYRSLQKLIQHNLVYKIGEERNQQFSANDFSIALSMFDQKKAEIETAKSEMSEIFSNLQTYYESHYKHHNMTIFQGENAYHRWNLARLAPETTIIREIAERELIEPIIGLSDYEPYMNDYITQRVARKIPIKVLISANSATDQIDITSATMLKERRVLPEGFAIKAMVSMWGKSIGFVSQQNGQLLAMIIHDQFVNHIVTSMFDLIWDSSRGTKEK
jgi:sugar-specific transcriptional regulator TrmB